MKKSFVALAVVALIALATFKIIPKKNVAVSPVNATSSSSYVEYSFDSGEDNDMGFTKRAYDKLRKSQALLDAGSPVIQNDGMTYSQVSEKDLRKGTIERRIYKDQVYELIQKPGETISGTYQMLLDGKLLFEEEMVFGTEGPIQEWRMVNGKPVFTFITPACATENGNRVNCASDIWYDGNLVSKTFGVKNPRYLFSYNNKIGFVASHNGADAIFYDDKFITPTFDIIWTHNCCSFTEILPTIYENGTLLFYAQRNEANYLVETRLN